MDFCKSCEELHAVSRIPLTIVHQEGEVRLALPAGHEDLIPHRALTWVLADFVLQKRDALHPLVTYGLGRAFALEVAATRSSVLTAAMAPGVNAYLFASIYGVAKRVAASTVLVATAASILTISVWLAILP